LLGRTLPQPMIQEMPVGRNSFRDDFPVGGFGQLN